MFESPVDESAAAGSNAGFAEVLERGGEGGIRTLGTNLCLRPSSSPRLLSLSGHGRTSQGVMTRDMTAKENMA